ncbi:multidrug resistance protein [Chloroflexus islandicus]|uniref:Multidrug resistance protein n=2 Tax=Chloroflexus islandicus TaxID=1707952 RepID=A0A178MAF8_9CHLR|nr:multidrug resistance protein [Chloroflexus islandicus]
MQQVEERTIVTTALADAAETEQPMPRKGKLAMSTIMLILIATALGVIGQMMLKQGMGAMGPLALTLDSTPSIILRIVTSPMVIGGLLIYGIGTFFWLITLSRIDLSVAYPFVSLNHIIIFLLAWLVLHEQVNPLRAAGVIVICAGMLMVARS